MNESKLHSLVKTGELYRPIDDKIECYACAHRCKIANGRSGICKVRYNQNGELKVPFDYVGAFQADPIEKKPFYHAYPDSLALSIGMLGCDFKCGYCQNWQISQVLRDENAYGRIREISVEEIIEKAISTNSRSVISTYNEPLITSEWAKAIFTEAKKHNLVTGYVSNGHATPEVLDYLRPVMDLYKIDLKTMSEKNYKKLGGNLDGVLESIHGVHKRGFWMEIVTLLVPGFNDDPVEIKEMAKFLSDISVDVPWHITGYHPDYKMENRYTTDQDIIQAIEIAKKEGMNYVYAGNRPGRVGRYEHTICPSCDSIVVNRRGFHNSDFKIDENGKCMNCGHKIPGYWERGDQKNRFVSVM